VYFLSARKKRAKSNDGFVRALTKMSVAPLSSVLPTPYGRSRPPLNSLRSLEKTSGRPARWLSGESDPPGILIAAIINEITRPD
jgi:hypothetical protein